MKKNDNILKYIGAYKLQAILAPLFKLLEASFELFVPLVVSDIIDNGIPSNDTKFIISKFLLLLLLAFVGLACSLVSQYFSAKTAVGFSTKIRQVLFDKIQTLDYNSLDKEGTSSLINKLTSDVNQMQTGVNLTLRLLLRSPFVVFGAMVMAFSISVKLAYLFVIVISILSIIVFSIMLCSMPLYKKIQQKNDKLLSLTRENLVGVRVFRAFNRQLSQQNEYDYFNKDLTNKQKNVGNFSNLINPLTFVCVNIFVILLIYFGAIEVNIGNISQGNVIALYNYMIQILVELIKLANLIIQITKAFASKSRIEKTLAIQNTLINTNNISNIEDNDFPILQFENVSLCYPLNKENSLSNISFSINKGETIGIIGGTGSGKTTLVNLIPHFYDASQGIIKYKGKNVQEIDNNYLREKISVVMQKNSLFSGTIRENILLGNENASDEEIINALKSSQSYDFVFAKKDNLDFLVEQDGRNLSGGQKQRLSIARALVKKPEILILDDSSSALDYKTDSLLRKNIKNLPYTVTQIIVSQRTSSIMNANKIIVLDDGKIAGIGSHNELLNSCKVYQEIYLSQLKGGQNEN